MDKDNDFPFCNQQSVDMLQAPWLGIIDRPLLLSTNILPSDDFTCILVLMQSIYQAMTDPRLRGWNDPIYTFTPKYNSINGQKDLLQDIKVAAVTNISLATDPNKRCPFSTCKHITQYTKQNITWWQRRSWFWRQSWLVTLVCTTLYVSLEKETLKDKISAFSILSSHLQQHLLIIHLWRLGLPT